MFEYEHERNADISSHILYAHDAHAAPVFMIREIVDDLSIGPGGRNHIDDYAPMPYSIMRIQCVAIYVICLYGKW